MRRITAFCFIGILLVVGTYFTVARPIFEAANLPDEIHLTQEEFEDQIQLTKAKFLFQQFNRESGVADEGEKYIDIKLLGLFRIKRVKVDVLELDRVIAGGLPIGFVAKTDGVVVLNSAEGFKKGDIIKSINGQTVSSVQDFNVAVTGNADKTIDVGLVRHGKERKIQIEGQKSLGLWVKDETSGVGMLTYINPQNNNFGSLGHRPTDFETGTKVNVCGGDIYEVNVVGVHKGRGKKVGEFQSALKKSNEKQGSILSSNESGLFGCLFEDSKLLKTSSEIYPVCSRYNVKPGKAKLLTSLDGKNIDEFDIEIVKTHYQRKRATKGMVIRIIDKRLIEKTGGIIHGMSGSPIIQNGKIVGALTHVVMGDLCKGYGIYIDFMAS